jgi:protein TonB
MDVFLNRNVSEQSCLTVPPPGRRRRSFSLLVSAAIHGVVLVVVCWRAAPLFVKPILLAQGKGGTSTPAPVTFYLPQDVALATPAEPLLSLSVPARKPQQARLKQKRTNNLESDKPLDSTETGSPSGSASDGPAEGDEFIPGYAVSYPQPRVFWWELPRGLQGDVVVEVTVDTEGHVIEEKLLKGLGHGIDEKVIAAVHDWLFRPATRNGVAIPFKSDVHVHFPS